MWPSRSRTNVVGRPATLPCTAACRISPFGSRPSSHVTPTDWTNAWPPSTVSCTSRPRNVTWSPRARWTCSSAGISLWHGRQVEEKKFTTTGLPRYCVNVPVEPSKRPNDPSRVVPTPPSLLPPAHAANALSARTATTVRTTIASKVAARAGGPGLAYTSRRRGDTSRTQAVAPARSFGRGRSAFPGQQTANVTADRRSRYLRRAEAFLQVDRHRHVGQLVLGTRHLRWPAAPPLAGQHLAVEEELTTPHSPRLAPLERTLEALGDDRADRADLLGARDVLQLLAEEQTAHRAGAVVAASVAPPVGGRQLAGEAGDLVLKLRGEHRFPFPHLSCCRN